MSLISCLGFTLYRDEVFNCSGIGDGSSELFLLLNWEFVFYGSSPFSKADQKSEKGGSRSLRSFSHFKNAIGDHHVLRQRRHTILARVLELATNRTRWSVLKNFTKFRAAQLTVLAPFVGYLIVFNADLRSYLNLDLPENADAELVDWLRIQSLTFLYFGLVLYGAATTIFSACCPNKIKQNNNIIEYIQKMEVVKTPNLVRRRLSYTVYRFLERNSDERGNPFFSYQHPSFPQSAAAPLHQLIEKLASLAITDDPTVASLRTATGHWRTDTVMQSMHGENQIERLRWSPLFGAAFDLSKEVFYVSYRVDDFSLFWVRVSVLILFVAGLAFLAVPTIVTMLAIILGLI